VSLNVNEEFVLENYKQANGNYLHWIRIETKKECNLMVNKKGKKN
jgi:hypothetical protein